MRASRIRSTPDFEPLAASFKRIKNILRQAEFTGGPFTPALLEPGPERELYDEINRTAGQPIEDRIGALRPKVDLFFDKVLVNAPDPAVRANRLAMLQTCWNSFDVCRFFGDCHELIGEDYEKTCLPIRPGGADGDGKMKDTLGGKGAGLAEMCRAAARAARLHHLDGSLQHLFREP
jgi:hypothetical protein